MKRIELFEFEDFKWLPNVLRSGATNLIVVLHRLLGTSEVLVDLIKQAQKKYKFSQIVDLGSGSGGAMPEVIKQFSKEQGEEPIQLLLTDKHPSMEFIHAFEKYNQQHIKYHKESVDATNFGNVPQGLKTMINSFHHMSPDNAKNILKSAQENQEPLLIYEMGENFVPVILWWLLLPLSLAILFLMTLFMTPFVKPLNWKQLVFTYLIPLIPIVYAWDGQASTMRTYTFDDINILLNNELKGINYSWEIGKAMKKNGKSLGYYLFGYPNKAKSENELS